MIRIIAVLCGIVSGQCHEQQITNSDFEEHLTLTDCLVGMPKIAEWMHAFPQYRLASWKCEMGERGVKL